jgi:spore coat protein CotH
MTGLSAAKLGVRAVPVVTALFIALLAARPARAQSMDEFFDDSVVHEIRLSLNSKDWAALKQNYKENIYYGAKLTWRGVTVPNVGIRSRGLGSRSPTKPGLRVDMDKYNADQTFLGLKSFVLDNLTQDPSMLRERLSMAFFRRLGLPAPREAHARLFVNDVFAGVYAIVETIDKGFLARSFGADSKGGTENDGYLFEYDYLKEYRFQYMGSNLDEYKIFKPKTHEKDADAQIYGPLEDMIQAVNETPNAIFNREVAAYLDLSKFVAHIAIENFIAEDDGILGYAGMNNFYMYRFEDSKRSQFLAWDKDNAFNRVDFDIMSRVGENVLARRTLSEPQYKNAYLNTLLDAAASAMEVDPEAAKDKDNKDVSLPGWLEREVRRQYEQIRSLARFDTFKPYSNDDFEASIEGLLTFARERANFVKDRVAEERRNR